MPILEFSIVFEVPAKIIYAALVDQYEVLQYTRAKGTVENKEGGMYDILDGRIQGQFQKLIVDKEIHMTWKLSDWKEYSKVVISLHDREDNCKVTVKQSDIPVGQDASKIENGWKSQIFIPMSKIRGYPIENDDD